MCHTIRQSCAPQGSRWACRTGPMSTVCPWSVLLHNGEPDVCNPRKKTLSVEKITLMRLYVYAKDEGIKSPGEETVTRCPNRSSVSVLAAACSCGRVPL